MGHKTTALILLCVSVLLMAAAVVLGINTLHGTGAEAASESRPVETAAESSPVPAADAELTPTPAPTEEPTPTAEPTATPVPTPTPLVGPDVPEQDELVTSEYFNDAGFLGNSILSQLWYYDNGGLVPDDRSQWAWGDGITILGAAPYAAQLAGKQLGKIYIELGVNELNYDKDSLRTAYDTVIDQLQTDHPDAIIYLMSVTPVSKWCNDNRGFKQSAVKSYNEMLRDIAKEQGAWYLDVYSALVGEDGFLPSDVTNDGVHFNGAHCQYWFDYLQSHYIPDGHSPTVPRQTSAPEPSGEEETPVPEATEASPAADGTEAPSPT